MPALCAVDATFPASASAGPTSGMIGVIGLSSFATESTACPIVLPPNTEPDPPGISMFDIFSATDPPASGAVDGPSCRMVLRTMSASCVFLP